MAAGLAVGLSSSPADAGPGLPSALGVAPVEVNLGGEPNDCSATIAGRLPSAATYELRIENPQDGTFAGAGGVSFTLEVADDDEYFDYVLDGDAVVFDVVVKGGQKSTHYDYDGNGGPGAAVADQGLHAPAKGNSDTNLYNVSHVTFCYEDALPVSGEVYLDANHDGVRDPGEGPDAPRQITVYGATGTPVATTTSAADGTYVVYLESGGTFTVCEDEIAGFAQTDPYLSEVPPNEHCASLGASEAGGHIVPSLGTAVTGLDFGNAPEICGQNLVEDGVVFDGTFELFSQGNDESGCFNKVGSLHETVDALGVATLALPLVGSGEVAGIGIITKDFMGSTEFEPLTYSRTLDGDYHELPWCGLRPKSGTDGDQFDPYISGGAYPSMVGVTDPGGPSVACKVWEDENLEGFQTTVVLIQDDPFWQ